MRQFMGVKRKKKVKLGNVKESDYEEREFCMSGGDDLLVEMNTQVCSPDSQLSAFRNEAFFSLAVGSVRDYIFTAESP